MQTLRFIATAAAVSAAIVAGACKNSAGSEEMAQGAATDTAAVAVDAVAIEEWSGDGRITPDANMPIIIDFNADWCGPCRMFRPVFFQTAQTFGTRARFMSVNVDDCETAARQFEVQSIPQVSVLYPDGSVTSVTGYMEQAAFDAFVTDALSR